MCVSCIRQGLLKERGNYRETRYTRGWGQMKSRICVFWMIIAYHLFREWMAYPIILSSQTTLWSSTGRINAFSKITQWASYRGLDQGLCNHVAKSYCFSVLVTLCKRWVRSQMKNRCNLLTPTFMKCIEKKSTTSMLDTPTLRCSMFYLSTLKQSLFFLL